MEPNKPKSGAKDFFLHFGAMIALYVSVAALLSLLFSIINVAFPRTNTYYYGSPSISFQVAELLVVVPIFFFLSWLVHRGYAADPEKKQSGVRRWITYITLFVTGAVVAGDLVYVLYLFLDGQDLTAGFLLKALSIFVILGGIFWYYLQDLRERVSGRGHKISAIIATVVVLASIVAGFAVIGSPKNQRLLRYDEQKVSALIDLQQRVTTYYQTKQALPDDLNDLANGLVYGPLPQDPQGEVYEYRKTGATTFELCASFNKPSPKNRVPANYYDPYINPSDSGKGGIWEHGAGRHCFTRDVDPDFFPSPKSLIR